jgi:hypothetical protein
MAISVGILFLIAIPALANGTTYSVSGMVIDVHGDPVKGANVLYSMITKRRWHPRHRPSVI